MPNKNVRYYQAQSDIVVDMLTYGWFGAGVREALMLGKPVVCYLRPEWLESMRAEIPGYVDELPIVSATPENVREVLIDLIDNPGKRREIGQWGREFAVKWHSSKAGARRFDRIYSELLRGERQSPRARLETAIEQRRAVRLGVRRPSGARVELAPLRREDLEPLFAWINDQNLVQRSAPYAPVSEADHREWFKRIQSEESTAIFGIRELGADRLIGSCQLVAIDGRHLCAELQIRIGDAAARGRGLGTEAVELLLDHAFAELGLHRVQLEVFAGNEQAMRSYEKAGLRREGVLREKALIDGRRTDVVVMAILAYEQRPRGTTG